VQLSCGRAHPAWLLFQEPGDALRAQRWLVPDGRALMWCTLVAMLVDGSTVSII